MKIEAFAICYNEEALLPYYLRHYSSFCDRITIFDNYSTDSSQEICRQNPKVTLIHYDTNKQIRDDIYLQIKNNCWKGSRADWVIVGDIDEFVYNPYIMEALGMSKATAIRPALFNMFCEEFPTTPGQIYKEVKKGIPGGAKLNLFRPDQIREINYDPGCHVAYPQGNVIIDESLKIKTLHMKNLSFEYLRQRTSLSRSRLSDVNKKLGWGVHYLLSDEELLRQFNEGMSNSIQVIS